jgi:hypothetical protein
VPVVSREKRVCSTSTAAKDEIPFVVKDGGAMPEQPYDDRSKDQETSQAATMIETSLVAPGSGGDSDRTCGNRITS